MTLQITQIDDYQLFAGELREIADTVRMVTEHTNGRWFEEKQANAVRTAAWLIERQRPVPVGERLPDIDKNVQWFSQGSWAYGVRVASRLDGKDWWRPDDHHDILPVADTATHWMDAPPEPA